MTTEYQSVSQSQKTVTHYPRPLGHKIRSCVLLIGIWFYFLFFVCIPEAKRKYGENLLVSIGSGMAQACALILLFFAMWGLRRTGMTRIVAMVLTALYCLGAVLLAAGRGKQTTDAWDSTSGGEFDDKAYLRLYFIGRLIGEVAYLSAGLLIILPDLGLLADWETSKN
eukprot:Rhum_TRINITY_DN14424_c18_g1::Rhum_TRINITY_DN14424_c18_g1_i1::g.89178::m.89178